MKSRVCGIFLVYVSAAMAQIDSASHRVRLQIDFANGICDTSTRVRLIAHSGPIVDAFPNDQCEVDFGNVPDGTYHVNVSGPGFPDSDNVITTSAGSTDFQVKVTRANERERMSGPPGNASVSAAELRIPSKAQREFDKANGLIDRNELAKAIQTLNRAIAIYPAYAAAYNNLGVIYGRLGDRAREREVLEKAIHINDHFAAAYVNLGRMEIGTGDFPGAEAALNKASSCEPSDAMTLVLLAYSEFMDRHIDQAIAASRRAHELQAPHAFAHQVAARAFEQKRDSANAVAELELFLKEEPTGERADSARKELAALQAIPR